MNHTDFILFDEGRELLASRYRLRRDIGDDLLLQRFIDQMADFLGFNEGRQVVEDTGWPATVKFDLSSNAVADFTAATAYAARAPITGTGYAQGSQGEPAATGLGRKLFTQLSWATGAATDWTSPKTIVASDGSKIICAWNLQAGGGAIAMNVANFTLNVTPDYNPTNPA